MKHSSKIIFLTVSAALMVTLPFQRCSCDGDLGGPEDGADSDTPVIGEGHDFDGPRPDAPGDQPQPDMTEETPICDEESFNITHVTPDMLIILDRSNSMMYNGFWDPTSAAVASIASTYQDSVLFGLMVFPDMSCVDGTDLQCNPGTAPVVGVALGNGGAIQSALASMVTCGGTPIAGTLSNAGTYLQGLPDSNPRYILLATDGAPNCNSSLDGYSCRCTCTNPANCALCPDLSDNCLDDARTNAAVSALSAAGIKTFVIGMSTAAVEWGDVLNAMASNGGTGSFYPAENPSQLQEVFDAITGMVATCEFDLNPSDAADPGQVNFYFDGVVVPRDPADANGWNWVDENTVQFYGSYCDRILGGAVTVVSATFGCPTIMI